MASRIDWRHGLHTFADENAQIYTVTNVPPIINISTVTDTGALVNGSLGSLLRPRIHVCKYPELPFLLRRLPVDDPLLSRLCVNPDSLAPLRFEGGWGLPDDIRNAWIRLEKGLLHVSELLLTSTEQSPHGKTLVISHPEDSGYRNLHASTHAAQLSIRRAHTAFQLLAARCSLAVALWLFPILTTEPDSATANTVPAWIAFLRRARVPSSWIDAISDSIITDFSLNLRIGAVFDASPSAKWPPILPVLRAANVPVFLMWHSPTQMEECAEKWPFMKTFAPRSLSEVALALQHPPAGKPRIVTLCFDAKTRPLPDYSSVNDSTPPFGPYQLPGESRLEFFTRRERHRPDQELQETQVGLNWRRERLAHAQTGFPPYRRSRVYLWVSPELVYSDLPPRWHGGEYRHPIPPSAYRSLWMVHPLQCRQYNSFYDEWDLWFPPSWGIAQDDASDTRATDSNSNTALDESILARHASAPANETLPNILDDNDDNLLNPTPEDRTIQPVDLQNNFHLSSWYGLTLADTRTFPEVDYETWDPAAIKCIAGWVAAVLARDWRSRALQHTWHLDARNPSCLLRAHPDPRRVLELEHHRAADREGRPDPDHVSRWVLVRFRGDEPGSDSDVESAPKRAESRERAWSLFTSPMGALLLARRLSEADTRRAALCTLVAVGVPARTGILRKADPHPPPSAPASDLSSGSPPDSLPTGSEPTSSGALRRQRRLLIPYREKRERPSVQDYDTYCQRVLELSHARAAWLKGRIVWRLMLEVTGRNTSASLPTRGALEEELAAGPSGALEHCEAVTRPREAQGAVYVDDALSMEELDAIAGVVKVYTGIGRQTEDASWWPKHSVWVRGSSYTGIWAASDEYWFQRRLKDIYAGKAGPLNAAEWGLALRRNKKMGRLAMTVDQASWEFTYRNFIQGPELEDAEEGEIIL
ncbi:hypothetical protein V8D89_006678 [Ganoderma adspersum]